MPAVLLGFHPTDSCVVLGFEGSMVAFCARLDLDWFVTHFDQVADQIVSASSQVPGCRFALIGFGDPDLASLSVVEMAGVVGQSRTVDLLVTDGRTYWSLVDGLEPQEFTFDTSSVAAQAVYEGVRISADRAGAVAPVETSDPAPEDLVTSSRAVVASMSDQETMELLADLVSSAEALPAARALLLAVLVEDEDRMAAVLTQLTRATSEVAWINLAAARRVAPPESEANVLALLGMASWLSGHGAAHTSCLEQLQRIAPGHAVGSLVEMVHRDGIPPRRWDE